MKQNKTISNNLNIQLNDIESININNLQNNDILQYNGTNWVNINSSQPISGTWIPTISNLVNLSIDPTIQSAQYTKIGSIVNGGIWVSSADLIGGTTITSFDIDLPITASSTNNIIGLGHFRPNIIASGDATCFVNCVSSTQARITFYPLGYTIPLFGIILFNYIAS